MSNVREIQHCKQHKNGQKHTKCNDETMSLSLQVKNRTLRLQYSHYQTVDKLRPTIWWSMAINILRQEAKTSQTKHTTLRIIQYFLYA